MRNSRTYICLAGVIIVKSNDINIRIKLYPNTIAEHTARIRYAWYAYLNGLADYVHKNHTYHALPLMGSGYSLLVGFTRQLRLEHITLNLHPCTSTHRRICTDGSVCIESRNTWTDRVRNIPSYWGRARNNRIRLVIRRMP